jgi:hypothetical protein
MAMDFEHRKEPLLSRRAFLLRMSRFVALAVVLILGALAVGVLGYHCLEGMPWIDALLNASMILGGMGPVDSLHTPAGKVFASCYALFSGLLLLVAAGVLFAPLFHRFLHRFHLDLGED